MYTQEELNSHKIKGKYPKEFLIEAFQKFYEENGRSPKYKDIKAYKGYPSGISYQNTFGSWNKALEAAGLPINQLKQKVDGTEICSNCGKDNTNKYWSYDKQGNRICYGCYMKRDYKYGNLDPNSSAGRGFIAEKIVMNTLESKHHCNCEKSFNFKSFDIYDEIYGTIDVKSATPTYRNSPKYRWLFKINKIEHPEHYFMIGFSLDRKNIEKIWVIPSDAEIIKGKGNIQITNSPKSLSRVKQFEVSPSTFNETYHSMSREKCPVLRS